CAGHGSVYRARDPLARTADEDDRGADQHQDQHRPLAGQPVDHGVRRPEAEATARTAAAALLYLSSHSRTHTESATIPPPACTYARPSLITAVRIAMAMSRSPWKSKYPTPPP